MSKDKSKSNVPSAVSEYMASLGAKGGAAGKGDPNRAELNRKAAKARWDKVREEKRKADQN